MLRPSVAAICFVLGLALLMGTPKGNAAGFSNRDFDGGYSCTVRGLISNPLTDLTPSVVCCRYNRSVTDALERVR
jgi:hypothetical protein